MLFATTKKKEKESASGTFNCKDCLFKINTKEKSEILR